MESTFEYNIFIAIIILAWFINLIPLYKIASKAGFGLGVAILLNLPVLNWFAYWFFAYVRWPIHDRMYPNDSKKNRGLSTKQ